MKKEVFEAQGVSVELVDLTAGKISEKELFKSLIQKGKHILEEKIEQASELSAFNVSSVNTVRAVTFSHKTWYCGSLLHASYWKAWLICG